MPTAEEWDSIVAESQPVLDPSNSPSYMSPPNSPSYVYPDQPESKPHILVICQYSLQYLYSSSCAQLLISTFSYSSYQFFQLSVIPAISLFQLSVIPWPSDSSYASDSFARALNTLVSMYPCMLDHETMNTTEHYCSGKVQNSGGHCLE